MSASRRMRSTAARSRASRGGSTLMATVRSVPASVASYTDDMPPSPIRLPIR